MLSSKMETYRHALRCVACGASGSLEGEGEELACGACGQAFGVEFQRPILLTSAASEAFARELASDVAATMVAQYQACESAPPRPGLAARLLGWLRPPEVMMHQNPDMTRLAESWEIFTWRGAGTRVLNVGGGPYRYSAEEVTLNIRPFANVDCVGDAHDMPFADNSFDSVICNAVLEHVYDPEQVVREIYRVLRPGGRVYAEVPFMFFFHGYPNDFKRYTREGMKRLFAGFELDRLGMTHGPVSMVLQSVNMLVDVALPPRFRLLKKALNGVYRWLLFPLKYLDLLFKDNPRAHQLAGGFYVCARKPGEAAA